MNSTLFMFVKQAKHCLYTVFGYSSSRLKAYLDELKNTTAGLKSKMDFNGDLVRKMDMA